jgi:hypothetical protein
MDRFEANNNDPLSLDLIGIIRMARRGRVAAAFVISEDQPQNGAHLMRCGSRLEPQPMGCRYSDYAESKTLTSSLDYGSAENTRHNRALGIRPVY